MDYNRIDLLEQLIADLKSANFQKYHKQEPRDFSRLRVLDFITVYSLILQQVSRSIGIEISQFLSKLSRKIVSKQAFSKARYKLKASGFIQLNDRLVEGYYAQGGYKTYDEGSLLIAIDGSDLILPWSKAMVEQFDQMDNKKQGHPKCIGKCIKVWDPLNQLSLYTRLYDYRTNEVKMYEAYFEELVAFSKKCEHSIILLGDRAYPSFWSFYNLKANNINFVFRCKRDQCAEIQEWIESGQEDGLVQIDMLSRKRKETLKRQGKIKNTADFPDGIEVRMTRFKTPKGDLYLASSLDMEQYPAERLKDIYKNRWDIETSFRYDKHGEPVENFSSKKPEGIRQEWHAAILSSNIAQLLIEQAQEELEKRQEKKNNKYQYKINRRIAIGLVRLELPKLLNGKETHEKFANRLIKMMLRYKEPIRPDRIFERKKKHHTRFNQIYR